MTNLKVCTKNEDKNRGDVYKYSQNIVNSFIKKNGDRHFNWKTFERTPQPINTKYQLRLTSNNFDIMQLDKPFITARVNATIHSNHVDLVATSDDDNSELCQVFIGR